MNYAHVATHYLFGVIFGKPVNSGYVVSHVATVEQI